LSHRGKRSVRGHTSHRPNPGGSAKNGSFEWASHRPAMALAVASSRPPAGRQRGVLASTHITALSCCHAAQETLVRCIVFFTALCGGFLSPPVMLACLWSLDSLGFGHSWFSLGPPLTPWGAYGISPGHSVPFLQGGCAGLTCANFLTRVLSLHMNVLSAGALSVCSFFESARRSCACRASRHSLPALASGLFRTLLLAFMELYVPCLFSRLVHVGDVVTPSPVISPRSHTDSQRTVPYDIVIVRDRYSALNPTIPLNVSCYSPTPQNWTIDRLCRCPV